jgi:hypothetical protein
MNVITRYTAEAMKVYKTIMRIFTKEQQLNSTEVEKLTN